MAQMFCEVCFKPNPSAFTDCGHLACPTCYDSRSPEGCPVCDNQQANVIAVAKVDQMAPHLSSLFKPLAPQLDAAKTSLTKMQEEATALIAEVDQVSRFQIGHYKKVAQAVQVRFDTETQRLEQDKIELMKELRHYQQLSESATQPRMAAASPRIRGIETPNNARLAASPGGVGTSATSMARISQGMKASRSSVTSSPFPSRLTPGKRICPENRHTPRSQSPMGSTMATSSLAALRQGTHVPSPTPSRLAHSQQGIQNPGAMPQRKHQQGMQLTPSNGALMATPRNLLQAPAKLGAGLKRPGSLATPLAPRNGVELQTPSHLHQNKGNSLSLTISSAQNMTNAPLRPPGEKRLSTTPRVPLSSGLTLAGRKPTGMPPTVPLKKPRTDAETLT